MRSESRGQICFEINGLKKQKKKTKRGQSNFTIYFQRSIELCIKVAGMEVNFQVNSSSKDVDNENVRQRLPQ